MESFIVVPEGLAADEDARPLMAPSFLFIPVLERVAALAGDEDVVYIPPGNQFNTPQYEQIIGAEYLKRIRPAVSVIAPVAADVGYIDTLGNAEHLISVLRQDRRTTAFVLVCSERHARRAAFCFASVGYRLSRVERVPVPRKTAHVVRRLWFYRYPLVHAAYEFVALLRDRIRVIIHRLTGHLYA